MFFKHGLGALAALVLTTNPAQANEAATTTQIAGAVGAQGVATGDREFSELFASWKSIDATGGLVAAAPPLAAVSVPAGMPLQDAMLTSDYGMRTHPVLGGRRNHKGVDLAQPTGTPVYATADGIVSMAERYSSYGNYIQIEHGGEIQLTDAMARMIGRQPFHAVTFAGRRFDCGSKTGFVEATLALALEREDMGAEVRRIAERLLAR